MLYIHNALSKKSLCLRGLLLTLIPSTVLADRYAHPLTSKYTDSEGKACRVLQVDKETGNTLSECPGVGGYKLQIADDDERMSIDVITPKGESHPLRFWDVITHAMSQLGPKVEWLVTTENGHVRPVSLIARINAHPDGVHRTTVSYLAVARITDTGICVTDRIPPSKTANAQARKAALAAGDRPCLTPIEE